MLCFPSDPVLHPLKPVQADAGLTHRLTAAATSVVGKGVYIRQETGLWKIAHKGTVYIQYEQKTSSSKPVANSWFTLVVEAAR